MFLCKIVVGYCAQKVHRHLSHFARSIAGPWIFVLAVCKYLMGICCTLVLSLGYLIYTILKGLEGDEHNFGSNSIVLVFVVSTTLSMVFQTAAAFSLSRIHECASSVSDNLAFSRVIGGWWFVLVCSTFTVGVALWLC